MSAIYYLTLTDYGSQLVANAHNQAIIQLESLVLGDANGVPFSPITQKNRTSLIHQCAEVPIQSVKRIGDIARVIATINSSIGGFNIHEIGLTDQNGKLVYIGNYHGGFKPVISDGAGGELVLQIDIKVESGSKILIEIDPNAVIANKEWVTDNFVSLTTFDIFKEKLEQDFNDLREYIHALYPKILASGRFVGANSTIKAPKGIDDLNDPRIVIHVTPEKICDNWTIHRDAKQFTVDIHSQSTYNGIVNWSIIQSSKDPVVSGNGEYTVAGVYKIVLLPNEIKQFTLIGSGGGGGGSVYTPSQSHGTDGADTLLTFNNMTVQVNAGKAGQGGAWGNGSHYFNGQAGQGGELSELTVLSTDIFKFTAISAQNGNTGQAGRGDKSGGVALLKNYGAGGTGANGIGDEGWSYGGGGGSGAMRVVQLQNISPQVQSVTLTIGKGGTAGTSGTAGQTGYALVETIE